MEFIESEFLIETVVPKNELIISKTDLNGIITYANEAFAKISGYSVEELVGQPHNIVRHPDMPKRIFEDMWSKIKNRQKWKGVVKNLRKDKGFYWVNARITGVYTDGELEGFKSIRIPVEYEQKLEYQKLYDSFRSLDKENIRKVIYQS